MSRIALACAAVLALWAPSRAAASDTALDRAVSKELKRSMEELRQEDYPRPYYISLTATDLEYLFSED